MSVIRIAILSDSMLFSEGLKRLLESESSFLLVGEDDGPELTRLLLDKAPHILLVDGRMDAALGLLNRDGRRPWAIVLTARNDRDSAVEALEAGAKGVLSKGASSSDLKKAIAVVHEGQIWARSDVVAKVVEDAVKLSVSFGRDPARFDGLSNREKEIARYSANGLSNKEIAGRLGISPATVKAHLTHVFEKMKVRDRAQLAALYHQGAPLTVWSENLPVVASGLRRSS